MNFKGIRLNIVIMIIILVLIAFFAGKHILKIYQIEQPLLSELKQMDGVRDVQLVDNGDRTDINVVFESNIDFYKSYLQVEDFAEKKLDEKLGGINVLNQDSTLFADIYYQLQYPIFEGISTNRFTQMKDQIAEIAAENNVDYKLWIDNFNVYLQLTGSKGQFNKIVQRTDRTKISYMVGGEENG